jgi:hypothetical protein
MSIVDAFVAAYRPRVLERLAELGVGTPAGFDEAMGAGETWLAERLGELVALPFSEQRRGPLEIFQEAMRFPTEVLEAAGLPPVARDEVTSTALPGDLYGLAPASSRQLGEDAWEAHLRWGAAKAARHRTPRLPRFGVYTANLMDRSRFDGVAGWQAVAWRSLADLADPNPVPPVCFVDLQAPDAEDAIRSLVAAGARVIAFGPHVDDVAMVRARSLGADDAMARSRFFRVFPDLLPTVM